MIEKYHCIGDIFMNIEDSKELLSFHSCRNSDIHNPKWEHGFMGSLRPLKGVHEENFIEVMECIKALKEEFYKTAIDREIISDIVSIVSTTRSWVSPDGMLGSNHLLTNEQTQQLLLWINIIEETLMYLLDGAEEEAFYTYDLYLDGNL